LGALGPGPPGPLDETALRKRFGIRLLYDLKVRGNVRKLTVKPARCWGSSTEQLYWSLEGSRVMGWWLVLLVNYAVIGNGSNMRLSYKSFYKEQTTLFDILNLDIASLDLNSFLAFFIKTLACRLAWTMPTMPVALITVLRRPTASATGCRPH